MTTQHLRVLASVHREHLPEQGGCRPVGQQSGELCPQPIQLRSRAGVRRPFHACPGRAAASTAEAGQPDRDLAEQRGDRVPAIVLHAANALATPAPRPPDGMVPGLRGDNLPLDARQHQLRFGQGQTQIGDVDAAIGPANLDDVRARPLAFRPDFHQPQNQTPVPPLGKRTSAKIPDRRHTPNLATVPRRVGRRLALSPPSVLPSVLSNTSAPRLLKFSRLNGWPMCSPTDASPTPSRVPTHGSGPVRIAIPSPWWTFTSYSLPVFPARRMSLDFCTASRPGEKMIG